MISRFATTMAIHRAFPKAALTRSNRGWPTVAGTGMRRGRSLWATPKVLAERSVPLLPQGSQVGRLYLPTAPNLPFPRQLGLV